MQLEANQPSDWMAKVLEEPIQTTKLKTAAATGQARQGVDVITVIIRVDMWQSSNRKKPGWYICLPGLP